MYGWSYVLFYISVVKAMNVIIWSKSNFWFYFGFVFMPVVFLLRKMWGQLARYRSHTRCFIGSADNWSHMVVSIM